MTKNPFIPKILSLLEQHPEGITEYLIIKSLEEHIGFDDIAEDDQLALFQKHFMVMNALYQLQKNLMADEKLFLDISPLKIQLILNNDSSDNKHLAASNNAKLSEYYLDWSHFENTDKPAVEKLLDNFWELYNNADQRLEALLVLELEENACSKTINQRYRKLAAIHHPDKGGDQATFIRIRQAYEILICCSA